MKVDHSQFYASYRLREQLRLPIKVCETLDYQQTTIKDLIQSKKRKFFPICCSSNKKKTYFIEDQFIGTFSRMTIDQKIFLYCKSINFLKLISQEKTESQIHIEQNTFQNVLVKGGYFGMRWDQNTLKLNNQVGTIEIIGKNDSFIDCHEYLVRLSNNNDRHAFSLQAIKPGFVQVYRFRINDINVFRACYQAISLLVDKCIFQNFRKQIQGMKQFRLPFQQQQNHKTVHLTVSKSPVQSGQQMDNLLTSYIQQQIKKSCISWGQITLNELQDKFTISDPTLFKPGQLFPVGYNEQQLYDQANYLSSSQYSQSLHQFKPDPLIFRLNKVYQFSQQQLINCFSDVEYFQKWNNQVKTASISSLIKGQNSIIINQIHKPIVKYYEARFFTYFRTLFTKGTVTYIVDRPLNCIYNKQFQHFVKGEVVFAVWKFVKKDNNKTVVDGIVKLNHKMIKNIDIQIKLTGIYLEGFLHLDNYLQNTTQRNTNIFNLKHNEKDFKRLTNIVYKNPEQKQNNQEVSPLVPKKDYETRKLPFKFQDDSFYSAKGASDWNSKLYSSKNSELSTSKRQPIQKSIKILNDIDPIVELPSANNTNSSHNVSETTPILSKTNHPTSILMKVSKHNSNNFHNNFNNFNNNLNNHQNKNTNLNRPFIKEKEPSIVTNLPFVPMLKPLTKINSIKSVSSQDQYKAHIVLQSLIKTDSNGECIISQNYISQPIPYPMVPKHDYIYTKMKGVTWNHYLLKDLWAILPNGELKCINTQVLKSQNGVFSSIIKRAAANIVSGKGLNMSLPVQVFSDLSVLELMARGMCFAPYFLEKAAKSQDAIQRLKISICFMLGFSLVYLEMAKPFNPILGETYQCWINGCPFYAEQISHHPPISSFLMIGRGFRVYGSIIPEIDLSMNSGVGYNTGECIVQFDQFPGHKIFLRSPGGQIQGLAYGDRKFNFIGKGVYYDNQGHYSQITFNPYKKSMFSFGKQQKQVDTIQGGVYNIDPHLIQEFRRTKTRQGINKKYLKNHICSIKGRYTQQVLFDNSQYFNIINDEPCSYDQQAYPLASNCNYRQDIYYKRRNQLDKGQYHKQRLEQIQRRDKKLRQSIH